MACAKRKLAPTELGYVEESEHYRLASYFFPSKFGGMPAWLALESLPSPEQLKCSCCEEQMIFLIQIYSPVAVETRLDTFHRTLFVFICRNPKCCSNEPESANSTNMVILRSQLPRENQFYSNMPLDPDFFDEGLKPDNVKTALDFHKLCAVCGCVSSSSCAQCRRENYCSKLHQEHHWKKGHKTTCKVDTDVGKQFLAPENLILFPEFELVTEREHFIDKKKLEKERPEAERMADYRKFLSDKVSQKTGDKNAGFVVKNSENLDDLESMSRKSDKTFKLFRERVSQNPEQVIRYQRYGEPLWANGDVGFIPKDSVIPKCELCGGHRVFELQLMPRLLHYMDVDTVEDSIDWATVAIYTCATSCSLESVGAGYQREFAWKQNYNNE